jgi:hypothetical protein
VDIEWGDVLLRAVSDGTESTTDGGSVTKVVTISGVDQNGTLTERPIISKTGLLFSRQWKMYVAQVQEQNKHSP